MVFIGLISIIVGVPLFSYRISPILFTRITSIILIYSALLCINVIQITSLSSGLGIYSGLFHVNSLTLCIDAFVFVCGAILLLGFINSNESIFLTKPQIPEFSLLLLFLCLGQSFLISSSDLISIYLSIELQSFAVYILCTLYRKSESATSAGLKYFLLGGISSAVILLGQALIYSYTGLTQFQSIFSFQQTLGGESYTFPITLGLVLIIIGFLFKVSAAPMHNWAPDVYDGVPSYVTCFIQTIPKISFFVFMLYICNFIQGSFQMLSSSGEGLENVNILENLLVCTSLLSLGIGSVVGLSQYRIKRLLAYSTIINVGFLVLCLCINTQESTFSFLFYLFQYTITNICTFLTLLALGYSIKNQIIYKISNNPGDIEIINELKIQFKKNPVLVFSLSMCLFSIAGIPPLLGFFAKQIAFYSAIQCHYYFMSVVGVLVSVISASYYLKIVKIIFFDKQEIINNNIILQNNNISNAHSFFISFTTIIITLFMLQPQILLNSSNLLALTFFYY